MENISSKRLVDISSLMEYLSLGRNSALKFGEESGAKLKVGRRTLYDLQKIDIVAYENQILGKPKDEEDARRMLSMLSGKTHSVYTGVTFVFIDKDGRTGEHCFYEKTDVSMYTLAEDEIDRYISSGDPMDKAGSYGIQGRFAIHIKGIQGDYNNVVGLPVARLYQELKKLGVDV